MTGRAVSDTSNEGSGLLNVTIRCSNRGPRAAGEYNLQIDENEFPSKLEADEHNGMYKCNMGGNAQCWFTPELKMDKTLKENNVQNNDTFTLTCIDGLQAATKKSVSLSSGKAQDSHTKDCEQAVQAHTSFATDTSTEGSGLLNVTITCSNQGGREKTLQVDENKFPITLIAKTGCGNPSECWFTPSLDRTKTLKENGVHNNEKFTLTCIHGYQARTKKHVFLSSGNEDSEQAAQMKDAERKQQIEDAGPNQDAKLESEPVNFVKKTRAPLRRR